MFMWRGPVTSAQQGLTFSSESETVTIKRLLDANSQSFEVAQEVMVQAKRKVPTVAAVIQEDIDLLIGPSTGTLRPYQTMLNLHIKPELGAIPIDELDFRDITEWIRAMQQKGAMQKKGKSAKTIKNNHSLIFSSMERAVRLNTALIIPAEASSCLLKTGVKMTLVS